MAQKHICVAFSFLVNLQQKAVKGTFPLTLL